MRKHFIVFTIFMMTISFLPLSEIVNAESITEVDKETGIEWELLDETTVDLEDIKDNNESINTNNPPSTQNLSPKKINTSKTYIDNKIPLEYVVKDGELVFFEQDGYHYDYQNWTQGYINAIFGNLSQTAAGGYFSRLTYKIAANVPYLKKILTKNGQIIKEYQNYVTAVGAFTLFDTPIFGNISYSPVPSVGSKEMIVYVSETGEYNSWHYRARFVLSGSQLTISKWVVK